VAWLAPANLPCLRKDAFYMSYALQASKCHPTPAQERGCPPDMCGRVVGRVCVCVRWCVCGEVCGAVCSVCGKWCGGGGRCGYSVCIHQPAVQLNASAKKNSSGVVRAASAAAQCGVEQMCAVRVQCALPGED